MPIHREGQWLTATRTEHVAYELKPGVYRLSLAADLEVNGAQARPLGLDPLDAVIRVQQREFPTTAAEWAEWSR